MRFSGLVNHRLSANFFKCFFQFSYGVVDIANTTPDRLVVILQLNHRATRTRKFLMIHCILKSDRMFLPAFAGDFYFCLA